MPNTSHPVPGGPSPWGAIQTVAGLGPDAAHVTTASHGGLWVSAAALGRIPRALRETRHSRGGWYEEDCDWAIPYLALGLDVFEPGRGQAMAQAARRTIWRWHRAHAGLLGVDDDPGAPERA